MERYAKLTDWLRNPKSVVLSFDEIEKIIGNELPDSAKKHRPWWGNEKDSESRHCRAWLDAGWEVDKVDLKTRVVHFRKT